MPSLTTARRSELRAQAHGLSPVVIIGDKGLSDSVVAEVDRALKAHELIKVKAATDDREARASWMSDLCARLDAQPVQSIGKILVLWRENPGKKEKKPALPVAKKALVAKKRKRPLVPQAGKGKRPPLPPAEAVTRSGRPRSPAPSDPRGSELRRRRPRTSR